MPVVGERERKRLVRQIFETNCTLVLVYFFVNTENLGFILGLCHPCGRKEPVTRLGMEK